MGLNNKIAKIALIGTMLWWAISCSQSWHFVNKKWNNYHKKTKKNYYNYGKEINYNNFFYSYNSYSEVIKYKDYILNIINSRWENIGITEKDKIWNVKGEIKDLYNYKSVIWTLRYEYWSKTINKVNIILNKKYRDIEMKNWRFTNPLIQKIPMFINEISSFQLNRYYYYKHSNKKWRIDIQEAYADMKTLEWLKWQIQSYGIKGNGVEHVRYTLQFINKKITVWNIGNFNRSHYHITNEIFLRNLKKYSEIYSIIKDRVKIKYLEPTDKNYHKLKQELIEFINESIMDFKQLNPDIDFNHPILNSPHIKFYKI